MGAKQTLVVIGNGMVGQNFLSSLVASGINKSYKIVTFCEEPRAAYDRVHLSEFFGILSTFKIDPGSHLSGLGYLFPYASPRSHTTQMISFLFPYDNDFLNSLTKYWKVS